MEMIQRGALDETLNQSFNRWSRSDTFMQVFVEKVVINMDFITSLTAFVKQCVINAIEEELKRGPQVTEKILPPPYLSPSGFPSATSDVEYRCRRSRREL